jgi:tetratricopeptide (TPR) repeat protein
MEFSARLKGLFRRPIEAELANEATRPAAIATAIGEARRIRSEQPGQPEAARKPLLEVAAALEELGIDPDTFHRAAVQAFPDDPHWRREVLKRHLPKAHVPREDLPLLREEARSQPRNLGLWQRLLEEARYYGDPAFLVDAHETLVLALSQFFPPGGDNSWYDVSSETQARSLFFNRLDDCTDAIIASGREDDRATEILEIAYSHFPNRGDVVVKLAHLHRVRGAMAPHSIGVILQALLFAPRDTLLKRCAARLLADRPGHEQEGFDIMAQVIEEEPGNSAAVADFVYCLSRLGELRSEHLDLVRGHFVRNPGDETAALLLADYYAAQDDGNGEAADALRAAMALRPENPRYPVALARIEMHRGEWAKAADALAIQARKAPSPQIDEAWALCLAHMGRADGEARTVLERVRDGGTAHEIIHDAWCAILYREKADDPEALEQFRETHRRFPGALWPQLGIVRSMIAFGDLERAQEKLLPLLLGAPVAAEAIELAARLLAADPRRQRIRAYLTLAPEVALALFARTAELVPDSLLILTTLARYRIKANLRDRQTADLLADICLRDRADVDIRLYRADLLSELGDTATALDIYRELLARTRETTSNATSSGVVLTPEQYSQVLLRTAEALLATRGVLESDDLRNLLEGALDPNASTDFVLRAASWLAETGRLHPLAQPVLERALAIDPANEAFDIALAIVKARRGNARNALQLALRRLERLLFEKATLDLLETVVDTVQPEQVNDEVCRRILEFAARRKFLPERLLVLLARLLATTGREDPRFVPLLERAVGLPGLPPEILVVLDRCRRAT